MAFDATDKMGQRYSIKTITGRTTGSFFGLSSPETNQGIEPKFDLVILVKFDGDFNLEFIKGFTWQQFLNFKRRIGRQKAYNLSVTEDLLKSAKSIYPHLGDYIVWNQQFYDGMRPTCGRAAVVFRRGRGMTRGGYAALSA